MTEDETWVDVGHVDDFNTTPLKRVTAMNRDLAVSLKDGKFGAVSNACNHVGGPLGDGRLDGDYIVCPWHNWRFHRCSGVGEPGFEEDRVPAYPMKVEGGRLFVNLGAGSNRHKTPHEPHPLSRKVERSPGPLRFAGISATAMDAANPRFPLSFFLKNFHPQKLESNSICSCQQTDVSLPTDFMSASYEPCGRHARWMPELHL